MNDTDDVVERITNHRVAGAPLLGDPGRGLLHGEVGFQRNDFGSRRHHVARRLFCELQHAFDEADVLRVEEAGLLALLDQRQDVVRILAALTLGKHSHPEGPENHIGDSAQERHDRLGQNREPDERSGYPPADGLGMSQRYGFGNELPEHAVQYGERHERDGDGEGVGRDDIEWGGQPAEEASQEPSHTGFSHPDESDTGQGETELRGRDVAVERLFRPPGAFSFAIIRRGQFFEARAAGRHQRGFGGNKKCVGGDQHHDRQATQQN